MAKTQEEYDRTDEVYNFLNSINGRIERSDVDMALTNNPNANPEIVQAANHYLKHGKSIGKNQKQNIANLGARYQPIEFTSDDINMASTEPSNQMNEAPTIEFTETPQLDTSAEYEYLLELFVNSKLPIVNKIATKLYINNNWLYIPEYRNDLETIEAMINILETNNDNTNC